MGQFIFTGRAGAIKQVVILDRQIDRNIWIYRPVIFTGRAGAIKQVLLLDRYIDRNIWIERPVIFTGRAGAIKQVVLLDRQIDRAPRQIDRLNSQIDRQTEIYRYIGQSFSQAGQVKSNRQCSQIDLDRNIWIGRQITFTGRAASKIQ